MVMRELTYRPLADSPAAREYQRLRELQGEAASGGAGALAPAEHHDRSLNPLRPRTLREVVGQPEAKRLVAAAVKRSRQTRQPLAHMLLVGPAGTGKSTLAHVVANELGVDVYQLSAPVSHDTLMQLRTTMRDGDVLFIDEIHLQAIGERRGKESITAPEVLYGVLEDRVIPTPTGVLPFPAITMMGGTTDEGMLSDAFLSRFPLRPRLVDYTLDDLAEIARRNSRALGASIADPAARIFAVAARGTPREVNNLVKNAIVFARSITVKVAREVLRLNGIEEADGLTFDMAALLRFIYRAGRQPQADGTVRYQCSVATIATGIGKSRDTKAVVLRIEPYLIRRGYLAILPGGRRLTPVGVRRAQELSDQRPLARQAPASRTLAAAAAVQAVGAW